MGCRLDVIEEKEKYTVLGNKCPRGKDYGVKELTNPTRVVTSTVKIEGGLLNRIPVKTNGDIPKDKVFECMKLLDKIQLKAPVKAGDIVLKNIFNTGIDVVTSRSM
ncbi:molybdopterin oxidoreductase [Anaeromicrobium sediminis]|uniref:Molybdopterin oxidoreductase n=2 Tax=Anaeromicrobium sediminis TaxID=1478221 RepID=A0A267MAW6_9FIRM|nr:molybdopterin oxidoreductase [Anaeromicrobium sediminis]